MSNPYYMHEYHPTRKGRCGFIYGGNHSHHCAEPEDALVHQRYKDEVSEEEPSRAGQGESGK